MSRDSRGYEPSNLWYRIQGVVFRHLDSGKRSDDQSSYRHVWTDGPVLVQLEERRQTGNLIIDFWVDRGTSGRRLTVALNLATAILKSLLEELYQPQRSRVVVLCRGRISLDGDVAKVVRQRLTEQAQE